MKDKTIQEEHSYDTKIGMLRQWLNEDRIKDAERFVTNEDIKHWLGEDPRKELLEEIFRIMQKDFEAREMTKEEVLKQPAFQGVSVKA